MAESRVAIETLAGLSDYAFEGDSDESLMPTFTTCVKVTGPLSHRGLNERSPTSWNTLAGRNGCMRTMPSDQGRCAAMNRLLSRRTARRHVRMANCLSAGRCNPR
jgi:hypothetical protein